MSHNSFNEELSLSHGDELHFHALMVMGMFEREKGFNIERLSPDQAAEYLWRRFVAPLEQR